MRGGAVATVRGEAVRCVEERFEGEVRYGEVRNGAERSGAVRCG